MRKKKLLLLAAAAALAVAYAVYDYKSEQREQTRKEDQSHLLKMNTDQIQELSLAAGKDPQIVLHRDKDGWRMLKPIKDEGDESAIRDLLEGLGGEKSIETVTEGQDIKWSNFGLDQPKGVIAVTNNLGETERFTVGNRRNYQGDSFVRKNEDEKVFVASSTWFAKLEKKSGEFRNKTLMRFSSADVLEMHLQRGHELMSLKYKDDKGVHIWFSPEHPTWKLDQNKVRELLSMLNSTQALEFIVDGKVRPDELKKWGLQQPRLKMTLSLKSGKTWQADFAAGSDKVHRVRISEPEFVLKISPTDSDKFFFTSLDSLRDRAEPFQFDRAQVKEIDLAGAVKAQLKLEGVAWKSPTGQVDSDKVSAFLKNLNDLNVDSFSAKKNSALDQRLVLKNADGKEIFKMSWMALKPPMAVAAKTSVYAEAFSLKDTDISDLKMNELIQKEKAK